MAAEIGNPKTTVANPIETLGATDPDPVKPSIADLFEETHSQNSATPLSSLDSNPTNGAATDGEESKSKDPATVRPPIVSSPPSVSEAPTSDVQRKMRRAERFGMPVKLSEEEKRSSRAERFGIGSALHGSDALKKSEELKRKSRAERFGLPVPLVPSDEEAKKKARLARFAAVFKTTADMEDDKRTPVSKTKTDSIEEDKRKARANRFSVPTSTSLSQVNVKKQHALIGSGGV